MEHLPPIITPFGPLRAPTGCTITHLRPRRAPLTTVERLGKTRPTAGLRRNLFIEPANDRFEREWEPLPWDNDEPALGGRLGLLIMVGVAVLIGVLLATGGVL